MKSPTKIQVHIDNLTKELNKARKESSEMVAAGNFMGASDRLTDAYIFLSLISTLKWVLADDDDN